MEALCLFVCMDLGSKQGPQRAPGCGFKRKEVNLKPSVISRKPESTHSIHVLEQRLFIFVGAQKKEGPLLRLWVQHQGGFTVLE